MYELFANLGLTGNGARVCTDQFMDGNGVGVGVANEPRSRAVT